MLAFGELWTVRPGFVGRETWLSSPGVRLRWRSGWTLPAFSNRRTSPHAASQMTRSGPEKLAVYNRLRIPRRIELLHGLRIVGGHETDGRNRCRLGGASRCRPSSMELWDRRGKTDIAAIIAAW